MGRWTVHLMGKQEEDRGDRGGCGGGCIEGTCNRGAGVRVSAHREAGGILVFIYQAVLGLRLGYWKLSRPVEGP